MPYEPLCRKFENGFFNPGNRSIHFRVNLLYQSLYEIKRAILWSLFGFKFTCETAGKTPK